MPMNATVMGALMKANIDGLSDEDKADRSAVFEALAAAVISHITANATIVVTVTSVSGVTAGGAVSGPGAGTATIT